jgi:hypothetical protein
MNRRELLQSGTLFTLATLLLGVGPSAGCAAGDEADRRPDPEAYDTPALQALALALNAPSPHNTQAWKFEVVDDLTVRVFVDETRLLPETDPPARQIHLGVGCLVETFVIGATRLGYTAAVSLFPDGYTVPDDIGVKPVALLTLTEGGARDPLEAGIEVRQTSRKPYTEHPSRDELEQARTEAGAPHAEVRFFDGDVSALADLFLRAFEVETRTYATDEETRRMFRFSEEERATQRDGISIPQMGLDGVARYFAEASLKGGDEAVWHGEKATQHSIDGVAKGLASAQRLLMWITDTNTVEDQVQTGRDYVRFSLAMAARGWFSHPYNQAIQEYAEMDALRAELDEAVGITGDQKIQMIVRVGRSEAPYLAWRRTVEDTQIA